MDHHEFKTPQLVLPDTEAVRRVASSSAVDPSASQGVRNSLIPICRTPAWRHQTVAFWFVVSRFGGLPEERT